MFKNNFKSALRNFWKNKFYTLINISGLAVGLATSIMLLLWVQSELSFDKFNSNYRNIYKLSSDFNSGGEKKVWNGVPEPLAILSEKLPAIESIVRRQNGLNQVISNKDKTKILDGNDVAFVDFNFIKMFSYPLMECNKSIVLNNIPDGNLYWKGELPCLSHC